MGKTIKRSELEAIIRDELNQALEALGVTKEKEELTQEMNRFHDSDGEFSTKSNAASESSYFVDKKRKGLKGGTPDKDDSGRGRNKHVGKGRFKLSTGKALYEDSLVTSELTKGSDSDRKNKIFPGREAMTQLARGIVTETFGQLVEGPDGRVCFDREQLKAMKSRLFKSFMHGIKTYEDAKKGFDKK